MKLNLRQLFCRHFYIKDTSQLLSQREIFDKDMDAYYEEDHLLKEHCVLCQRKRIRVSHTKRLIK
jgi:hypothetical protein